MTFAFRSAAGMLMVASAFSAPLQAFAQDGVDSQQRAAPTAVSGQVVVRDVTSGQLRAPTAEEAQTLRSATTQLRARTLPRAHLSGARGARLTDDFMSYSVLVRQPDGSLAEVCYASREEAEAATLAPSVVKTTLAPTE